MNSPGGRDRRPQVIRRSPNNSTLLGRSVSEGGGPRCHPYPTSLRERNQDDDRDEPLELSRQSTDQPNQPPPDGSIPKPSQLRTTFAARKTDTKTTERIVAKVKKRFGYRSRQQKPITVATQLPKCGNKRCMTRHNHTLAIYSGPPNESGFLEGCPLCNTNEHLFDYCEHVYKLTLDDLYGFLVENRNNKPPLSSTINLLALIAWKGKVDCVPLTANISGSGWRCFGRERDGAFSVDGLQFSRLVQSKWDWYTKQVTWVKCILRPDLSLLDYDSSRGFVMNFVPVDLIQGVRGFLREQGIAWKDEHRLHLERCLGAATRPPVDDKPTQDSRTEPNQTLAIGCQTQTQSQPQGLLSAPGYDELSEK